MSLNFLILTMIFHTYLAHLVSTSRKEILSSTGSKMVQIRRGSENYNELDYEERLEIARKRNNVAKIVFAGIIVVFNGIFWSIALTEKMKTYDSYL